MVFFMLSVLSTNSAGLPDAWFRHAQPELTRLLHANTSSLDVLAESLTALGVVETEWDAYLSATLLALRGWGGMINEAVERADRFVFPAPSDSLIEFLAVRLLLERFALDHAPTNTLHPTAVPWWICAVLYLLRFLQRLSPGLRNGHCLCSCSLKSAGLDA